MSQRRGGRCRATCRVRAARAVAVKELRAASRVLLYQRRVDKFPMPPRALPLYATPTISPSPPRVLGCRLMARQPAYEAPRTMSRHA
jgi:hypothetical protein